MKINLNFQKIVSNDLMNFVNFLFSISVFLTVILITCDRVGHHKDRVIFKPFCRVCHFSSLQDPESGLSIAGEESVLFVLDTYIIF